MYYERHIFVCENQRDASNPRGCCAAKNSPALKGYMKDKCKELGLKKVRVNMSGCLDRCELGAVMVVYPDGIWYHYNSEHDIDEIINSHLVKGKPVARLMLNDDQKRL